MVNNTDTKVRYRGNGSTTVFPITFPFTSGGYVRVRIADETTGEVEELDSDFYVDSIAHTVTYPGYAPGEEPPEADRPPVLASDQTITIYRKTTINQLTELGTKFPLPQIETAFDKITNILLEHDEEIVRAVKVDISSDEESSYYYERMMAAAETSAAAATSASASATSAANSASSASTSAANAANSETNAAMSAISAANSAASALSSKNSASTSETNAATAASAATTAATNAANSAAAAAASANAAASSQNDAAASAASALENKNITAANATISTNAATTCSEILPQVLGAASAAATSATNANASKVAAALSASSAATDAQTASTAASTATTKAGEAAASATAAAASAASAADSAAAASTSYDQAAAAVVDILDIVAEAAVTYPAQSGTLTYTGSVQTPVWDSYYQPNKMVVTGDTSGTNAGTYTVTLTPKSGYYWLSDDTTTAKTQTWTIGRATIASVPSQSGVLVYNGSAQSPTWSGYDPTKMTISGSTSETEEGTYTVTFTPDANHKWSDGTTTAKEVTWVINAQQVTAPTVTNTTKTYNGSSQAPTVSTFDSTLIDVLGDASAINAGSYMITFHLKSTSLVWSDNTTADKSVSWTIGPKSVTAPTVTNTSFTYDGTSQGPTISSYDTDAILVSGATAAVGAGSYSVIFSLVSASNYVWSDTTTAPKSTSWSISPLSISVPELSNKSKSYTGAAQGPTISQYDSNLIEVSGTTSATNAGTYTVTFHLINANVQWSDTTTADKSDTWTISKIAGSLSLSKATVSLSMNQLSDTVTVTRLGDGVISAVSSDTSIATVSVSGTTVTITAVESGSATVTVSVADGTNYNAPSDQTVSVSVQLISTVLNENTPEQIQYVAQHDLASSLWDIGDYFEMTLNGSWQCTDDTITLNNYVIRCVLIGINHNADKEGNHLLHFQMGKNTDNVDVAFDYTRMNTEDTNFGGWNSCKMRTITMANLYSTIIPSNWRAVIKACTKYTDNTGRGGDTASYVTATSDNCFLLAEYEVFGARTYANSAEQTKQQQYAYYANGNSKIRYIRNFPTSKSYYWLRGVDSGTSNYFCMVSNSGSASSAHAHYGNCFSPAFCIG